MDQWEREGIKLDSFTGLSLSCPFHHRPSPVPGAVSSSDWRFDINLYLPIQPLQPSGEAMSVVPMLLLRRCRIPSTTAHCQYHYRHFHTQLTPCSSRWTQGTQRRDSLLSRVRAQAQATVSFAPLCSRRLLSTANDSSNRPHAFQLEHVQKRLEFTVGGCSWGLVHD